MLLLLKQKLLLPQKFVIDNCISCKKWSSACQKLFQMRLTIFFCSTNWSSAIYFALWTDYGNIVYLKQQKYMSTCAAFEAKNSTFYEKC
jgi:hypothetical protein